MSTRKTTNHHIHHGNTEFKNKVQMHNDVVITGSLQVSGSIFLNGSAISSGGGGGSDGSDHDHDSSYSSTSHNHTGVYAASGHNHDSSYVGSHNHDSDYLNTASIAQRFETVTMHVFNYSGTHKRYIPWQGNTTDSQTALFYHFWLAPLNGKLKKVFVNAEGEPNYGGIDPGSTVVAFHRSPNAQDQDPPQITAVTASVARNTTQTFTFADDGKNTFLQGQCIALSLESYAKVADCTMSAIWELSGSS
tara:strand:+ start:730 stop:1473 length:744 start_codon:yes stop_codon:yes gene_type:complete